MEAVATPYYLHADQKLELFYPLLYCRNKYLPLRLKFYFTYCFHRACAQRAAAAHGIFHHNPFYAPRFWRGRRILRAAMQPDLDKYWPYLDGYDLNDSEKRELIHTLWSMMESFVDSAFGTHPVQQCLKAKARNDSNLSPRELQLAETTKNKRILSDQFSCEAEPFGEESDEP
jgi:hypothetical protein